jgi:hypothetical protein
LKDQGRPFATAPMKFTLNGWRAYTFGVTLA